MKLMGGRIVAVIVAYNPNLELLWKTARVLAKSVKKVLIIDNSEVKASVNIDLSGDGGLEYIWLGENKGIAYAQNYGILLSLKIGAEYIVTFDQDSIVDENFVPRLYEEYCRARVFYGERLACIGPSVINDRDGRVYKKYFEGGSEDVDGIYSVRSLISSGTLYPVDIFVSVGLNKAEWFIDSIDLDWCYRARFLKKEVLMTTRISMRHNLGVNDLEVAFGKKINVGAPIRLYYVFRNWVFSLREAHFCLRYKVKILIFLPIKFVIFSLVPPRSGRMKYMMFGIIDGVRKRYGRFNR